MVSACICSSAVVVVVVIVFDSFLLIVCVQCFERNSERLLPKIHFWLIDKHSSDFIPVWESWTCGSPRSRCEIQTHFVPFGKYNNLYVRSSLHAII